MRIVTAKRKKKKRECEGKDIWVEDVANLEEETTMKRGGTTEGKYSFVLWIKTNCLPNWPVIKVVTSLLVCNLFCFKTTCVMFPVVCSVVKVYMVYCSQTRLHKLAAWCLLYHGQHPNPQHGRLESEQEKREKELTRL